MLEHLDSRFDILFRLLPLLEQNHLQPAGALHSGTGLEISTIFSATVRAC